VIKKCLANGPDESLNRGLRAGNLELSFNNLQLRQHRLIQQINRLLKPLILNKCRINFFSSVYRSMAKQMLNVSDGITLTEQVKVFLKLCEEISVPT
jgi:hypothetical protein